MAQGKNNEELKAEAIANLAASRAEISTEAHRLRHDLSPRRVMHRVVDRHKPVIVGAAAAAGLVAVLLVWRRGQVAKAPAPRHVRGSSAPSKAGPGIIGILAPAIIPALIKSLITPGLIQSLIAKRRADSATAE